MGVFRRKAEYKADDVIRVMNHDISAWFETGELQEQKSVRKHVLSDGCNQYFCFHRSFIALILLYYEQTGEVAVNKATDYHDGILRRFHMRSKLAQTYTRVI